MIVNYHLKLNQKLHNHFQFFSVKNWLFCQFNWWKGIFSFSRFNIKWIIASLCSFPSSLKCKTFRKYVFLKKSSHTFLPKFSTSVLLLKLRRFATSIRLIVSYDFSKHLAISSTTVSTNLSMKKLYTSAGEVSYLLQDIAKLFIKFLLNLPLQQKSYCIFLP